MSKRLVEVDLFRVMAAMLVVILHVLGQGGVLNHAVPNSKTFWVAWFLEIGAYCAVNCFALISGYVMCNKTVRLKNVLSLWFHVLFYSVLFNFLFFAFVPETRTLRNLITTFLPVLEERWWYVSAYFAVLIFIPFLNSAINNIPKRTFKKFLIAVLFFVSFVGSVVNKDPFILAEGYSSIWLIVLYLLGAYINKYGVFKQISALKSIAAFSVMIVITFLSKFFIRNMSEKIFGSMKDDNIFVSYTSITIVLAAVFLFYFCLNVKIGKFLQKLIAIIAPTALSVYLIHVHPFVFYYVIDKTFSPLADRTPIIMIFYVLLSAIIIFSICSAIDLLRIQLFKFLKINRLCEILDNKISGLYLRVFKE